jgi:hypothetical protein
MYWKFRVKHLKKTYLWVACSQHWRQFCWTTPSFYKQTWKTHLWVACSQHSWKFCWLTWLWTNSSRDMNPERLFIILTVCFTRFITSINKQWIQNFVEQPPQIYKRTWIHNMTRKTDISTELNRDFDYT